MKKCSSLLIGFIALVFISCGDCGPDNDRFISETPVGIKMSPMPELFSKQEDLVIHSIELRIIEEEPFFWVNDEILIEGASGNQRYQISELEAKSIATAHLTNELTIAKTTYIANADLHEELKDQMLPGYVITFEGYDDLKGYVSSIDADFKGMWPKCACKS